MKKITKESIEAFYKSQKFRKGNTEVEVLPNVTILKLHGNGIAWLYNDPERTLSISNGGWGTTTTKERLNGLKGVNLQQKNYIWYLNGKKWSGQIIDIK